MCVCGVWACVCALPFPTSPECMKIRSIPEGDSQENRKPERCLIPIGHRDHFHGHHGALSKTQRDVWSTLGLEIISMDS